MKKLTVVLFVAALLTCPSYLWPSSPPAARGGDLEGPVMRAYFIEVGQANATLLEFPCGAILIDAGAQPGMEDDLVAVLEDFFMNKRPDLNRTLKSIIVTHNHIDHTAGLRQVIERFTVERYIDHGMLEGRGTENPNWIRDEVEEEKRTVKIRDIKDLTVARAKDKKGLTNEDIDPLQCDTCDPEIHLLSGRRSRRPADWDDDAFDNKNNHSLVTRVDFDKFSLLFTGDMEEPAIALLLQRYKNTKRLDVDLYHVGHHGSDNGTTQVLLDAMTPKLAVISVGQWDFGKLKNPTKKKKAKPFTTHAYGHPRRSVIEALEKSVTEMRKSAISPKVADGVADFHTHTVKSAIYATAWDGTITLQADTNGNFTITPSNQ